MLTEGDLSKMIWEYCVLQSMRCVLQNVPVSVQADEIVVEALDGMLHKQNLEPFGQRLTLTAGREVSSELLQFFG